MSDLIGNELPNETLVFMDKDKGPQPLKIFDFCKGKKIVIFGVPGAFTPTCARNHLPGFIENADKIKEKEVEIKVSEYLDSLMKEWEPLPKYFITSSEKRLGSEPLLNYIHEINQSIEKL